MRITERGLQITFDCLLVIVTALLAVIAIKQVDVSRKAVRRATQANQVAAKSADAAKRAADAAVTQAATSQAQFELSERPWVLAAYEIDKPLTFLPNGSVVIVLKETWQNSGQSAAVNVGSWADLVPLGKDGGAWNAAINRQTQYCDKHRLWKDEIGDLPGFTLFPKEERTTTIGAGMLAADLAKAIAAASDPYKRIGFAVVGCVWYRAAFEPKSVPAHQTRFIYLLGKPIGPPESTVAFLQAGAAGGTQPMVEPKGTPDGLKLTPTFMGNSAD